jgi:hypothetical protein
MPLVTSPIAQESLTANQTNMFTASNISSTPETNKESTGDPPAIVSGSQSLPIITPALHSSAIPAELSSSVESASIQFCHVSHPLGSPPSSLLSPTHSDVTPQMTSVIDTNISTSTDRLGARERDETRDANPSIPTDALLDAQQPEQSIRDIAEDALPPGHR